MSLKFFSEVDLSIAVGLLTFGKDGVFSFYKMALLTKAN